MKSEESPTLELVETLLEDRWQAGYDSAVRRLFGYMERRGASEQQLMSLMRYMHPEKFYN